MRCRAVGESSFYDDAFIRCSLPPGHLNDEGFPSAHLTYLSEAMEAGRVVQFWTREESRTGQGGTLHGDNVDSVRMAAFFVPARPYPEWAIKLNGDPTACQ